MAYSFEQFKKDLHEETLKSFTEQECIQVMNMLPVEKRLEGIPAKQLLEKVSTEQRLEGIPAEQLLERILTEQGLADLSAEEIKQLLAELNKKYS